LWQCAGEEVELDAKASVDTCEEAPQPQPKPRKKKKAVKKTGKCLLRVHRLPEYAPM